MRYSTSITVLVLTLTTSAQNNAIFTTGTGDGYARSGAAQPVTTSGIFTGGTGDGYARNGSAQPITTAGIFTSGTGDGYARNGAAQPVTTAGIFTSGTGDGYARNGTAQPITTTGIFTSGTGDGYARNGVAQPVTSVGIFTSGTGDGYARNGAAQPITTAGIFTSGPGDGYARNGAAQPITTPGIFGSGQGDGYARGDGNNLVIALTGIAFLEGPYNPGNLLMNDQLRANGLIPLTEPFTALGYPQAGGGGGETTSPGLLAAIGDTAVVDWVRIELRNATTPTLIVATRQALLQRDGTITSAAGEEVITFAAPTGSYHIVVRHRNHLGAMTANLYAMSGVPSHVDFSSAGVPTFGTAAQKTIGAVNVLWAGDVTGNHQLKYTGVGNDRDPILVIVGSTTPNNTVPGQYDPRDVNMDGTVKYTGAANDRDPILVNVGSTAPNNTRSEQVP